jgi:hypothetical protein
VDRPGEVRGRGDHRECVVSGDGEGVVVEFA